MANSSASPRWPYDSDRKNRPSHRVIFAWQESVLPSRLSARTSAGMRAGSTRGWGPSSLRGRSNADDRLLATLRQHWGWTLLGLIVAAVAMATRFAAIGILPPSIQMKPFAHATASTKVVLGRTLPSDTARARAILLACCRHARTPWLT